MGHAPSPLAPVYFILETSAALPETGFLAEKAQEFKDQHMLCTGRELSKEVPAKKPLPKGAWPLQPAQPQGQQWLPRSHHRKAKGDYFLARLHPASWEHVVYENAVMGLDRLKHRIHHVF